MNDDEKPSDQEVFDLCSFMSYQIEEINKHKYIESEKAGRDLGQAAICDWINKHAKDVRAWAEKSGRFLRRVSNLAADS